MMEDFSTNTGQGSQQVQGQAGQTQGQPVGQNLGIAALITAIITFVLAVIPCVGLIAIIPGIIAIVLAAVGLSQAARNDSPRGVLLAALIIAVIASFISFSQVFVAGRIARKAEHKLPSNIENVINDLQENVIKNLQDETVNIKVESNGNKVEITTSPAKTSREQELEKLEKGNAKPDDTIPAKK
jgi:hypothetical protein